MDTEKSKPSCADFIIAAARVMRSKPQKDAKTPAKVGLRRIFEIAIEIYSDHEFTAGLQHLVDTNKVIIVAKQTLAEIKEDEHIRNVRSMGTLVKITRIPRKLTSYGRWYENESTHTCSEEVPTEPGRYYSYYSVSLYIAEDGIPDQVKALESSPRRVMAEKILATMQK